MLCAGVRIFCFFVLGLKPVFQSQVSPFDGGLCLAGYHVVARTDTELLSGMH